MANGECDPNSQTCEYFASIVFIVKVVDMWVLFISTWSLNVDATKQKESFSEKGYSLFHFL